MYVRLPFNGIARPSASKKQNKTLTSSKELKSAAGLSLPISAADEQRTMCSSNDDQLVEPRTRKIHVRRLHLKDCPE